MAAEAFGGNSRPLASAGNPASQGEVCRAPGGGEDARADQIRAQHLARGVAARLADPTLSDIVLVASDGEEVACHRIVLACSSEYFERMFEGPFAESRAQRVELSSKSGDTLRCMLRLLYLAVTVHEVLAEDPWRIPEVFAAAQEWMLPDIVDGTINFVSSAALEQPFLEGLLERLRRGAPAEELCKAIEARFERRLRNEARQAAAGATLSRPGRLVAQQAVGVPARRGTTDFGWGSVRCPRVWATD